MRKVIFRIKSGGRNGQETSEVLLKKFNEYRQKLIKDGETILSEHKKNDKIILELR